MTALPRPQDFMLVEAGVFGGFGRHRAMPIGNSRSLTRRTPLLGFGEIPGSSESAPRRSQCISGQRSSVLSQKVN